MAIYQTRPIERPAIWGGKRLREYFRYPWFGSQIGQSWSFSGQAEDSNLIENGIYQGKTLRELWHEQPQLFLSRFEELPVIISPVAPIDDLSIQIHPNAEMAAKQGYSMGKNEAWYFLEAEQNGSIVYGHHAKDENELRSLIAQDRWDELAGTLPVKKDDFVYLPAGMMHALRKGSIVYEIQQATDVTYRFYDYHRKDAQGNERLLHLEQAIACVDYTLTPEDAHPALLHMQLEHATMRTYIRSRSFCVSKLEVNGEQPLCYTGYKLFTVVAGTGRADGLPVQIGSNFLLPAGDTVILSGEMTLMATGERETVLIHERAEIPSMEE